MTVPICIAGMHRSGTSLVAHLLQVCGVYLGDDRDLVPASPANPDGYWEHRQFVALNEDLLAILGGDWGKPATIPEPSSTKWSEDAHLVQLRERAESLGSGFAGHKAWGWKDPRNGLTLPFWFNQFPDLKVVVCVRHPLEVAASLRRVDPNASIADGVERWAAYYTRLLADAPAQTRLLTHAGSYFAEPTAEIQRIAAFSGLSLGEREINAARAIVRPDLRRNRFTSDDVSDFDLPARVLGLYAQTCDEAGWNESRARKLALGAAPTGAVAVEELERLTAARTSLARRLAAVDARLDRDQDDLLRAMEAGGTVRGLLREYRQRVEYRRMVRNVRDILRYVVPHDASMLVIGRGDDELLVGPRARHFPQGIDGGYAGNHPASSLSAIAHLEALRALGAEYLVVPATELWWLEQYPEFGNHIRSRYRLLLEDAPSCHVFDLRSLVESTRSLASEFDRAVSACEEWLQREPAILDWETGQRLASGFPNRTVFAPPGESDQLPYLDHSVDIVAVAATSPQRIAEAERVASAAVLIFDEAPDSAEPVSIRWIGNGAGQLPSVSVIVPAPGHDRATVPMLRSLRESRLGAETDVVVGPSVNGAAAQAAGEILVFLEPEAVVLPDWLSPLLRALRDRPQAGAIGGKVFASDGQVEYSGDDAYWSAGPPSEVVRSVESSSPVLLATRRTVFESVGGFDQNISSASQAADDYCRRLRARGLDILFHPDSAAVRVGSPQRSSHDG